MTLMWPDRRGRTLLWGAKLCKEGDVWRSWMRGEKRSETDEGREVGGCQGGREGRGGGAQSCQIPESPGQKWNKCWLVLILSNKHPATDSGTKLQRKGTINLGLVYVVYINLCHFHYVERGHSLSLSLLPFSHPPEFESSSSWASFMVNIL